MGATLIAKLIDDGRACPSRLIDTNVGERACLALHLANHFPVERACSFAEIVALEFDDAGMRLSKIRDLLQLHAAKSRLMR
ncbi:hypothetical protein NS228_12880 [Methylobacterium indicum]|nr:hypothetical protein NS229_16220 [Methylobacterium indicum]KTS40034.1 hypothetical protein NS228_12880 [Methylobacterium indicum]KTS53629.1 hypothetical protein NS230_04945 [Methylobacterium indicum]